MKIYTGYFAKLKTYQKAGLKPVSIALSKPRWLRDVYMPDCRKLNPAPWTLEWAEEKYTPYFNSKLAGLAPWKVVEELEKISNNVDVVLLCWEKPEDFCHRQLVAVWLSQYLDYEIAEFGAPAEKKDDAEQLSLF